MIVAIQQPRICNAPLEELKGALRYVMVLVGLKAQDWPVEEEKAMLLEYILENYGGHTAEEIKLAFKMAIQSKLKLDSKEVTCYGNFSPVYFTKIMDAYRLWASEQIPLLPIWKPQPKEPTCLEKVYINLDYAAFLLNQINKLPVKI